MHNLFPQSDLSASLASLNYRLVIFDSDGTLADTLPWIRSIFNDLADEHGFRRVKPEEAERLRNLEGTALLRELKLPLAKLPGVLISLRSRMAEHGGKLSTFAGIPEVLRRLSGCGIQLAVVSSNSQANVERILGPDNSNLFTQFSCGVAMFGKAARLRQVIRASAIPRQQAIYVGDEIRDAQAARRVGIAFGAVGWGQHGEDVLRAQEPAFFFRRVQAIADELCRP